MNSHLTIGSNNSIFLCLLWFGSTISCDYDLSLALDNFKINCLYSVRLQFFVVHYISFIYSTFVVVGYVQYSPYSTFVVVCTVLALQ